MNDKQVGLGWRLIYANYRSWRCVNLEQPHPPPAKKDFERYEDARRALDELRVLHGHELVGTVMPIPVPKARISKKGESAHLTNSGRPIRLKRK